MTVPSRNVFVGIIEDFTAKENEIMAKNKLILWYMLWWRAILAEFLCTTFLVLLGCMSCVPFDGSDTKPPIYGALGFGLAVLMNIQAFGHISGAHMNPSVTLAAVLWRKISLPLGIAYILAQCLGSIFGYGILIQVSPTNLNLNGVCTTQPHERLSLLQAVGVEFILTMTLIFLVCAMWDPVNAHLQESSAIKFGLAVVGLSIAGGSLTGASLNPARTLGPALWSGMWNAHWLYWTGPFVGSGLAALFYKFTWLGKSGEVKINVED